MTMDVDDTEPGHHGNTSTGIVCEQSNPGEGQPYTQYNASTSSIHIDDTLLPPSGEDLFEQIVLPFSGPVSLWGFRQLS